MKLPPEGEFYFSPGTGVKLRVDKKPGKKIKKPVFSEQIAKADLNLPEKYQQEKK